MTYQRADVELADRKRQLIAQSDLHRRALSRNCEEANASLSWLVRAANTIRSMGPLLLLAGPIVGYLLIKRKVRPAPPPTVSRPRGVLGKVWHTFQLLQQMFPVVMPIVQGVRQARSRRAPDPSLM